MDKKALVVDNDYFFVEFLSELLAQRGYQVIKAYDGKEGIAKLENGAVDIIFSDLVLPKIDGRQLFKFVRSRFTGHHFPMVALSGIMIEQLGSLDDIGADYYIAKGPIDQLSVKLSEFLAEFESRSLRPSSEKEVLATGNIYPRRDAMELMNSLLFHQAVIESTAVGIITVDDDTRILNANPAALEIVGIRLIDALGRPISELFSTEDQAELIYGLKSVKRQSEKKKYAFIVSHRSQVVGVSISAININDKVVGWVVVMEPAWQNDLEPSLN
jgi:PAS domain S-box-containing protein